MKDEAQFQVANHDLAADMARQVRRVGAHSPQDQAPSWEAIASALDQQRVVDAKPVHQLSRRDSFVPLRLPTASRALRLRLATAAQQIGAAMDGPAQTMTWQNLADALRQSARPTPGDR